MGSSKFNKLNIWPGDKRVAISVGLVLAAFIVGHILGNATAPVITNPTISRPAPGVTTIQLPIPVITERVVRQYIRAEDQEVAQNLIRENEDLKIRVEQLSASLAVSRSTGGGTATISVLPATDTKELSVRLNFKDWRLDFTAEGEQVNYTLSQRFSILNSVGRDRNNVPTNLVRLYEIGPNEERIEIPVTETTTIAAEGNAEKFYVKPTLQGGFGYVSATGRAWMVAVPWLKRGTTTATEDTRYAFLSPAVSVGKNQLQENVYGLGVLPVSVNLGTLPNQPFTNVWVSPYLGIDNQANTGILSVSGAPKRYGVVVSVTF